MSTTVGMDIGRRNAKIITKGYSEIFNTTAVLKNNSYDSDNSITVNGNNKYVIGLGDGNPIYNDDKSKDTVFEVCMLYGLSKIDDTTFDVVTGLPITHWKLYKDNLEKKYSNSQFTVECGDGTKKTIKINRLRVLPEGIVCVDEDDEFDTLIIDIGGLTVDVALYKDGKLVAATSYELGVRKMYSSVAEELNKTYGTDYTIDDIERYMEKGSIIYNNRIHAFDFTPYKINFLQKIISSIKEDFGWKKSIKRFVGGGSIVFKDILSAKGLEVDSLAIYANAIAFYNEGVIMYG